MAKTLGQIVKDARESADMDREKLAKKLKVSPIFLMNIERDFPSHVSDRIVSGLKKHLGRRVSGITERMVMRRNTEARKWGEAYRQRKQKRDSRK